MIDAVAFMRWERVVPLKILSIVAYPDDPLIPVGYGVQQEDFYTRLEKGSQIWVLTRISNKFTLAGRVTVKELYDREELQRQDWPKDLVGLLRQWQFVARADREKSDFYETNNAQPVMDALGYHRFNQGRTELYHEGSLTDSFQGCVEQGQKTVFISYRWKEARSYAFAVARQFRRRGWSPWLDAHSMPKFEAKRERDMNRPRLQKMLKAGIHKSLFSIIINTPTFGQSDWTRFEFDHIQAAGKPWYQVMRKGGIERPGSQPPIRKRTSNDVVEEILARWAEIRPDDTIIRSANT